MTRPSAGVKTPRATGPCTHVDRMDVNPPSQLVVNFSQRRTVRPALVRLEIWPTALLLSGLETVNCRPTRAHHEAYGERPCRPPLPCLAAFTVPVTGASSLI
jgi:hypothetical protein